MFNGHSHKKSVQFDSKLEIFFSDLAPIDCGWDWLWVWSEKYDDVNRVGRDEWKHNSYSRIYYHT